MAMGKKGARETGALGEPGTKKRGEGEGETSSDEGSVPRASRTFRMMLFCEKVKNLWTWEIKVIETRKKTIRVSQLYKAEEARGVGQKTGRYGAIHASLFMI